MKRMKISVRLAALCLAAVMLVGCGVRLTDINEVSHVAMASVFRSYAQIPDDVLYPQGISVAPQELPRGMGNILPERITDVVDRNAVMRTDYFEVFIGDWYELYIRDLRTGHWFSTNPVFLDFPYQELRDELFGVAAGFSTAERVLYSQIDIEYINELGREFSMWSFPDAVSPNRLQISHEVGYREVFCETTGEHLRTNPTLTVTYGIGINMDEFPLMIAMSVDTFERHWARMQELVDEGHFDRPHSWIFHNAYTLLSWDDMIHGRTEFDPIEMSRRYPALPELGYIRMLRPLSNRHMNEMLHFHRLLGIGAAELEAEEELLGESQMADVPAFFRIPLVYELDGNSILTYVDTNNIVQSNYDFTLTRININRTFGASLPIDDGYIFIPDGSGSIIRNDEPVRGMNRVDLPFFGPDFGKNFVLSGDIPGHSTFPVFGSRRNDVGMFAVVENGAALGGVIAQIAENPVTGTDTYIHGFHGSIPYNMVFPYLRFHDYDHYAVQGIGVGGMTRMFTQQPYRTQFKVRYNFLYDGRYGNNLQYGINWATYSGWAAFYQKYLERMGVITRITDDLPLPLDINLIGSISKVVNTFGVPWERDYAVTTFEQAASIMNRFRQGGIMNANLVYSGAINGGLDFRSPNRVRFQSELGGLRGFNNLHSEMERQGVTLFNEVDFARAYRRGHGISLGVSRSDTSRNLMRLTAVLSEYSPAGQTRNWMSVSAIMNPLTYNAVANNFIGQYQRVDSRNLYLATIGGMLNSNFNDQMEVNREETIVLTRQLLERMRDEGFNIMLDTGNAYVLEFADSLINVPTSSSGIRMESYSIPFVGMVLKGFVPFTGESVNRSGNMHRALLEAVESGAGLQYTLMYANQLTLIDTRYQSMFSVNYEIWLQDIIDTYNTMMERGLGDLANVRIVGHERLAENSDVARVTYENGWIVYVNYGRTPHDTGRGPGYIVGELDYLVVRV